VDLEGGEGDYSVGVSGVGWGRYVVCRKFGERRTYGRRRPNAKITRSLVGTAAWRPHTRWTAMTNRPTSVAMSRAMIAFH